MKLLLIEDNKQLAESLRHLLGDTYIIDIAHTGTKALDKAVSSSYDLVMLDLHLPDMTGLDICMKLRGSGMFMPILVLTANDDKAACVELLRAGADDYLTKPFHAEELSARLSALSRRVATRYGDALLTLHDLTIDTARRQVKRGSVPITLRRKEFDILHYLVRNRGRTVTREMILDNVWESDKDRWNNTVDVHIKHLRDKIDRPFGHPIIKTAYGIGYMVDDAEL